jgi:hypothetical protein
MTAPKHPDDLLPVGRKTTFKEEYCEKAIEYAENELKNNRFPTIAGFAVSLGTSKQTVYSWAQNYPQFLDALELFNSKQEHELTNGALNGKYNASFSTLMAKNFFGFKDKNETELTGKDGSDLIPSGINITFVNGKE